MNSLDNYIETYREYSLASTDDLIRLWRSRDRGPKYVVAKHPRRCWGVEVHGLKPTSFTNPTPRSLTSSSQTASTDYCLDHFFWAKLSRLLFLFFPNFFLVSGPCARLSWLSLQLFSARWSIVSYRIVSFGLLYCRM